MNNTRAKGIKISPNYRQGDWNNLDLSRDDKEQWNKAIDIFKDRMEGRYFKQIEALDQNKDRAVGRYAGFAIMSLTCLLIETIEQFWAGNIETSRANITGVKKKSDLEPGLIENQISSDSLAFFSSFQRSNILRGFFDSKEKADVFYIKVRCGLLHQRQTKGKSLIHIREDQPILKWINENDPKEGLSIQRRLFLNAIKEVYEDFIKELQKPNSLNFRRKTLQKKMQYIVDQK